MWVKIRASEVERAEWHAKARSAGLTLSDLVRRSVGRVRTWTVAHAEVERERTRQVARIGTNLNQIARWANTYASEAEVGEVVAHWLGSVRTTAISDVNRLLQAVYIFRDGALPPIMSTGAKRISLALRGRELTCGRVRAINRGRAWGQWQATSKRLL